MIVSVLVLSVTVDHYLGLLTATGGVCCTRGAPPAMLRAPREKITTLLGRMARYSRSVGSRILRCEACVTACRADCHTAGATVWPPTPRAYHLSPVLGDETR